MAFNISSRATPQALQKLKEFGLSDAGAAQALNGQMVANAQDRTRLAGALNQLLSGKGASPRPASDGNIAFNFTKIETVYPGE